MASAQTIAPLALSIVGDLQSSRSRRREIEADRQRRLAELRERAYVRARQRRDELKRAQATARARFGGQGRTASGGSAQAVLNGLLAESRRRAHDDRRLADRDVADLDASAALARRRNLLATRSRVAGRLLDTGLSLLG